MRKRTAWNKEKVTDAQLVVVSRTGDVEAFQELVHRYQRRLFGLCYRLLGRYHDAEDACQETFLRAFRALDRYDADRPFDRWLLTIAANCCVSVLRRRRSIPTEPERLTADDPGETTRTASVADQVEARELGQAVGRAIAGLADHYRIPFVLFHQEEMNYEEISQALALPLGTVKSRVHRARERLYEELSRAGFLGREGHR
ncbi:MAG: sigma-70 family RNA polymerase sigma factor [Planctomycetes bacterium]|nr:sigma-70 family RNA polymerase sigma factor [Planctomycetota bacterium]